MGKKRGRNKTVEYHFKLFVADEEPNSKSAIETLNNICNKYLKKHAYTIEIIDVLKDYKKALEDNILLAPTLIITTPYSRYRIVGSLNEIQKFIEAASYHKNKNNKSE